MSILDPILHVIRDFALPALFTVGLALFFWGVLQYLIQGKYDEEAREKGKAVMLYGIGIFVLMVFVWGIVHIATGSAR